MGVVGTVVVEADALVCNSDCRVAPARTLVLFPPSRFFRLCRCGTLLRGSTFPGNRLWAHVCSESCAHLSARAWYIRIGRCLPERRCFLFSSHHDTYVFTSALTQFVARCASRGSENRPESRRHMTFNIASLTLKPRIAPQPEAWLELPLLRSTMNKLGQTVLEQH